MNIHGTIQKNMDIGFEAIRRLEDSGHEAYLVGGFVREILRKDEGAKPTDIDVATDADPRQVMDVFSDMQVIETGIKHGTVTVMMPSKNDDIRLPIEITTYRREGKYGDKRHPDTVQFVSSLREDLSRRDFTINAMAMGRDEKIIDPFGGEKDLDHMVLRTVGDPEDRFREDALRIMRGLRFASTLGLTLEGETEKALLLHKALLKEIAAERIFVELKKTLTGKHAGSVIRKYIDIFEEVIPELEKMKGFDQQNPYHRYDVLEHCIKAMENVEVSQENKEYMKLAALLHDVGKPDTFSLDDEGIGHFYGHQKKGAEICREILSRLKADAHTIVRVSELVAHHDLIFKEDEKIIKRWMGRYGPDILTEVLDIKRADNIATGNVSRELLDKYDRIEKLMERIVDEGQCFSISDMKITGRDVMDAGVDEGPEIGRILDLLLEKIINGDIINERETLLKELESICSDHPNPS